MSIAVAQFTITKVYDGAESYAIVKASNVPSVVGVINVTRAGLVINPLLAYNPTSLTTVAQNTLVRIAGGTVDYCYYAGLQLLEDTIISFTNTSDTVTSVGNTVDVVLSTLDDLASDNKLTPTEKQQVKLQWDSITSEKTPIDSQADTYGIVTEKNAYDAAYTSLSNYITTLLQNLSTTSDIVGTTFRDTFKAYFTAKYTLLDRITVESKNASDNAQSSADSALGKLTDMSTDSKLTPVEKLELNNSWEIIKTEKTRIDSQADTYSITTEKTNYGTSYNTLSSYITPLLADLTTTSDIIRATFIANLKDYYDKRQLLLSAIATTSKNLTATAQADATNAKAQLSDIANDNKLTPVEKQSAKKDWDAIVAEKTSIDTEATTYSITTEKTTYDNAYATLSNYITPLLTDLTTTSDIVGTTFRSNFNAYYDARTDLYLAISGKAKTLADTAQATADNINNVVVPSLTSRVTSVEQKTTSDAIVATVTDSVTYFRDTLLPKTNLLTLSRTGLAINPLTAYNPTSLAAIANNTLVSTPPGTQSYVPWLGGLEIVDGKSVTFDRQVDRVQQAESNIAQLPDSIVSTVKSTITDGLGNRMTSAESSITQNASSISLVVKQNNGTSVIDSASIVASINNGSSKISMSAVNIDLTGLVSFNSMDSSTKTALQTTTGWIQSGKTTINGALIETGTLKVNQILMGGANGTISWANVDKSGASASDIGARPSTWTPSASDVGAIPQNSTGDSYITTLTQNSITTGTMILNKLYTANKDYYICLDGSKFSFKRASDNVDMFYLSSVPETNVSETVKTGTRIYMPDGCSIDPTEGSFRSRCSRNNYLRINKNGGLDYIYPTDGNGGTNYNQITIVDSNGVLQTGTGSNITVVVTPKFG